MCQLTIKTPTNPTTGKDYGGKNIERLIDAMDKDKRLVSGSFATFRQWLSVGRCVMKGEKASARLVACSSGSELDDSGEAKASTPGKFLKGFSVFALEQTAVLEDTPQDATQDTPAKEDKPEPGKVYSLSTLSKAGNWAAAEITEPAHVKVKPLASEKVADKADRLLVDAERCFADRLQNTRKRLAQTMHKRMDGQRMERAAHILKAYLHAVDGGSDPLPGVTHTQLIKWAQEAAIYNAKPVSNGYHGYHVETSDAKHTEAHHVALRGLLDPRKCQESADKIAQEQAEASLRNIDAPGFFPTPPHVVKIMLEQAGDLSLARVLEPSAGKGDLVAAAFSAGARAVDSFEIIPILADYLAKHVRVPAGCAHNTCNRDFLVASPLPVFHDAVLMNPPFEKSAAPAHVLHALNWLKPGGRLVSVMPAGWIEKDSATPLLDAIEAQGRSYMEVEIDGPAFSGAQSFRSTGVRVSLLVVY